VVKLVAYYKATGGQTDPALERWLAELPQRIRRKLCEIGLLNPHRVAGSRALSEHLEDFKAALKAKGCSSRHVDLVEARARRVIEGCGFRFYADISASKVMTYLDGLREDRKTGDGQIKRGISAQTFNFYLAAVKQFCRWMVKDRRVIESPVHHLDGLNVKTDRRHDRRALSVDDLCKLLDETRNGPERYGMGSSERAILYWLAVETGLRAGELRSLTRASFELDASPPTVTVTAAYPKRRRDDTLPLRSDLAAELRPVLARLAPGASVFNVPRRENVARMFRADLKAAGIPYRDDAGRVADFHSLRHSFITNLIRAGVHNKTAQDLARHSTPTLTGRYTHGFKGDDLAVVNALPDLSQRPQQAARATGTDDARACAKNSAECLAPKGRSGAIPVGASRQTVSADRKSPAHEKARQTRRKRDSDGLNGEGGIRTRGTPMKAYAGLANRCIQPLCHLSKCLHIKKLHATSLLFRAIHVVAGIERETPHANEPVHRHTKGRTALVRGRRPQVFKVSADGLTVKDVYNAFLAWQKEKLDAREIGLSCRRRRGRRVGDRSCAPKNLRSVGKNRESKGTNRLARRP